MNDEVRWTTAMALLLQERECVGVNVLKIVTMILYEPGSH